MYDNQVKLYKRKYKQFRIGLKEYSIKKGLVDSGYTYKDIRYLLEENLEELKRVIEKVLYNTDIGRAGKVSNVLYMGVLCEFLDKCNIWYTMHVGFVLPTKVKSKDYYKDLIICNYMYIKEKMV